MEEKTVNKRLLKGVIKMPKSIIIGDPSYFEEQKALKYTYNKQFRDKTDWKCAIELYEDNVVAPPDEYNNEPFEYIDRYFKVYLACDDNMLSLLKENKHYTRQELSGIEIGVDTAEYILAIDDREDLIKTGGDGSWGYIVEYKNNSKLEAVQIEMGLPTDYGYSFENHQKLIEYIFDCKLK